ncbi:hypothetical protein OIU77_003442 [Salix suchowensis]|uniref:Uncharacterized protein n=1 Tax=Salix suchowensis TaxID=1278906 RepID=A0ABQ9B107_9ROSI|nr:hypothetical protein OIU77_003442 [Salix suchowensis]
MDMSLRRVIPLHSEVLGHLVDGQCRALAFVNDDTMIIATETDVIAYQVRAHTMEWVIDARTDGFVKYLPYVNSLASVGPLPCMTQLCIREIRFLRRLQDAFKA